MKVSRGTLSLDLDGTLVCSGQPMSESVIATLAEIQKDHYTIVFNTGRNFAFAMLAIRKLPFPYYVIAQNGATLVDGETKKVMIQRNLPHDFFHALSSLSQVMNLQLIVEAGAQNDDSCYYLPDQLTKEQVDYFNHRQVIQKKPWTPVRSWNELKDKTYSMVKAFGPLTRLQEAIPQLEKEWKVSGMAIRDPFKEGQGILLINAKGVNKGAMLERLHADGYGSKPFIVAGDDACDGPMLKVADIALVAEKADLGLKHYATKLFTQNTIEKSLKEIIEGLQT